MDNFGPNKPVKVVLDLLVESADYFESAENHYPGGSISLLPVIPIASCRCRHSGIQKAQTAFSLKDSNSRSYRTIPRAKSAPGPSI